MCDPRSIDAYVIALADHRTDLPAIRKVLPKAARFDAVDCRSADLATLPVHPVARATIAKKYLSDRFQMPSKGSVGCALSHYALWKRCVYQDRPMVVIEEDVRFDAATVAAVLHGLRSLPADTMYASLVYVPTFYRFLGIDYVTPDTKVEKSAHEGWYKHGMWIGGTQCYYVTPAGAETLLEHAFPIAFQVDIYIGCVAFTNPSFRAYAYESNPYRLSKYLYDSFHSTIGYGKFSVKCMLPENNWFYAVVVVTLVVLLYCAFRKR